MCSATTAVKVARRAAASEACQRVVDDYGQDPALREQVAQALVNMGFRLGVLGRSEEAVDGHASGRHESSPWTATRFPQWWPCRYPGAALRSGLLRTT